jgi:hypothetical protein
MVFRRSFVESVSLAKIGEVTDDSSVEVLWRTIDLLEARERAGPLLSRKGRPGGLETALAIQAFFYRAREPVNGATSSA